MRKVPSLALPPQKTFWGRRWGRGRFSKRSASPPDPLSRRVAGNRLVLSFGVVRPCEVGAFSCFGVMVTAADRAAVTTTKPIGDAPTSQAEPTPKKCTPPNASRSSGERGLGGEGLLSEKPPLPPESPHRSLSGREREGGSLSTERLPPSHISIVLYFVNPFSASTTTVEVIVAPLTASTSSPSFTGSTLPMN